MADPLSTALDDYGTRIDIAMNQPSLRDLCMSGP